MYARFVTRARSTSRAGVSGRTDRWRCGREAGLRACALRARGPPRPSHKHHTLLRPLSIPPPSSGPPDAGHARVASRPRKRLHPPGLFRSAGKHQKRYRPEMPWAPRGWVGRRACWPAQRRSARADPGHRLSPGGSRPPAARPSGSHGAEGAGNHTRCHRGSRRDGAPGMERRSCAYLLAIRARLDVCDGLRYREEADRQACQAALARRIRRRRSAARSSSFRPPHTPYFSGRDSA